MKILLDSDILLDFFFNREPYFTYSKEVLDLCEKKKVEGFITPVIFSNVYYLLRKNFSKEKLNYIFSSAFLCLCVFAQSLWACLGQE